jgi:hypothetical protein
VTVEALRNAVYPLQWLRLMIICFGTAVQRMDVLGVGVRNVKEDEDSGTE